MICLIVPRIPALFCQVQNTTLYVLRVPRHGSLLCLWLSRGGNIRGTWRLICVRKGGSLRAANCEELPVVASSEGGTVPMTVHTCIDGFLGHVAQPHLQHMCRMTE